MNTSDCRRHTHYLQSFKIVVTTISLFLLGSVAGAEEKFRSSEGISPYCGHLSFDEARIIERQAPTRIAVVFDNYRKWQKNSLKIIRSRSENILAKHRKKFSGSIEVTFPNSVTCRFKARIRQNGDWKDHILIRNGQFVNSLDVALIDGHINNVVKFKLLIPETRNGENEVIFAELLRKLGFVSPKTFLVDVDLNDRISRMVFQEKQAKELIEFNGLREGPMFEGDETLFWTREELQDALTGMEDISFSRLVNDKWAVRGPTSLSIALIAQTKLNRVYATTYSNRDPGQSKFTKDYFDTSLLSNEDKLQQQKLDAFDALLYASGGRHAMRPHNRKYYYDAIYEYFVPIYYDGDIGLPTSPDLAPVSLSIKDGASAARRLLKDVDPSGFADDLERLGVETDRDRMAEILGALDANLAFAANAKVKQPGDSPAVNIKDYLKMLTRDYGSVRFADIQNSDGLTRICGKSDKDCSSVELSREQIGSLMSGEFISDGSRVVFAAVDNPEASKVLRERFDSGTSQFDYIRTPGTQVGVHDWGLSVAFSGASDWLLVERGFVGDMTIKARGRGSAVVPEGSDEQRFNSRLLTGCLSFVDTEFDGARIQVSDTPCEDAVNIIRGKGRIDEVVVSGARFDALDVDFSDLEISNVAVSNAGNDCVDVSAGRYRVDLVTLKACGDKGLSVGEGSSVSLSEAIVRETKIGLAVKDSSSVDAGALDLNGDLSCIEAYRKKQEFSGGSVEYVSTSCPAEKMLQDPGSQIVARGVR